MPDKESDLKQNHITTGELLLTVNRHKWYLLFALLIISLVAVSCFKKYFISYSSSVSFLVNESPLIETNINNNQATDKLDQPFSLHRIQHLIHSNDMIDHLIKKFSLFKYYGVDTTKEFYYERTLNTVMNSIELKYKTSGLNTVIYKDRSRYKAAEIANEIVYYLDTLNKKLIISSLRKRLDISKILIEDIGRENYRESSHFDSLLDKLNVSFTKPENPFVQTGHIFDIQQKFLQNISALQNSTDDLIKARKFYELTLQLATERNLPNIIIIQKAFPDDQSNIYRAMVFTFLITFSMLSMYIFTLYQLKVYKNHLMLFFQK